MTNSTIKSIQNRIKQLRKDKDLTQEILSERSEISRDYLSEIERGKKIPSLKRLIKIVKALDISLSDFFEGID